MSDTPEPDLRIGQLKARFSNNGFRVNDAGNTRNFPFQYSASKVRFDYVGTPVFLEEFFIFQAFDEVTKQRCYEFTDMAWEWAIANENMMPKSADLSKSMLSAAIRLAGGAMGTVETAVAAIAADQLDRLSARQFNCVVYVYAIASAPRIAPDTLEWIWSKKSAAPRKDGTQATFVVPVIYDSHSYKFHHFKKRPILGNVFYTEARKVIKKRLIE